MVELLAPAGSREALTAAVESGANAIYLAGNMFGARAYADNFDEQGLIEAIRFAHMRDVHIHVTVNTIVDDKELTKLAEYLQFLYRAGADAVLVQDLGVARLVKQVAPGLPMHASTQMTVHNLAGVQALEKLGFSRVVLSRELSLKDIRYICSHSKAEIEVFIHGALCVCYSGQCLMSSMIGGRSGNRGRCAQPCRLPYTLVDAQGEDALGDTAGKYLLSPRDMNTIELLPDLVDAGVSSLKIEGRMKRPEYVAIVVDTYRRALDSYASGSGYSVSAEDKRRLAQIFNRDFTTAYLERRPGREMMSDRRPNNRGLLIGRVTAYDWETRRVTVKLAGDLTEGDQVDFWVKVGGRVTATIHDLFCKGKKLSSAAAGTEVSFPVEKAVHVHDRVFKVFDAALMAYAKTFFTTGAPVRRIPLNARVRAAVGEPLFLEMTDRDGNTASASTSFIGEKAQKRPLTEETIRKQLTRLGTTVFALEQLNADIEGEVLVPVSEINDVRRQVVELLEQKRLSAYERPALEPMGAALPAGAKPSIGRPALISVTADSLPQVRAAIESGAEHILFGGESYSHEVISIASYREAWELARSRGIGISFNTPRIVNEAMMKLFVQYLEAFREFPPDAVNVHNIGMLSLVKEHTEIPVHADYSLIAYNSMTLAMLEELGVHSATLSPELNFSQLAKVAAGSSMPLECIVHGRIELMVSEYCVTGSFLGDAASGHCARPCVKNRTRYALRDRKDEEFPLVMDQFCHMHVLNAKVLSLLPHAMKFAPLGVSRMRIEGRGIETAQLRAIVKAYREYRQLPEELTPEQKDRASLLEGRDITRGHYFRGVL